MSVDNNCPQLGIIGNIPCPRCGGPTYKNETGANICTNKKCKFWFYSLTPPPQLEKESLPNAGVTMASAAKTLTSSQKYIVGLRRAFGYKSNREIYRLRKQLGNINIVKATHSEGPLTNGSHEVIVVTYQPAGGLRRFPLVQHTVEVETNATLQEIQLSGLFPHMRGFVNPQLSGQAVFAKCYVTDSTGPQANV